MPFYEVGSEVPAEVVIEQLTATRFKVMKPFRYVELDPAGKPVAQFIVPDPRWGDQTTDLASVPEILSWVVPRYGRHTLPAILHDQILRHDLVDQPERADRIFRDAMGEQRVPLVMRWVMWAAVSMRTICARHRWAYAPIAAWIVLWAATAFRLTPPFAAWKVAPFTWLVYVPWYVAAGFAVVGPPVLALTWVGRYDVGAISGYGAFLFAVPITAVVLALGVYRACELALEVFDTAGTVRTGVPAPPPAVADVRDLTVRKR